MIVLRVRRPGEPVHETVFRTLPVRIGRGPENDLVLVDPAVSRSHAQLESDPGGRLVLRDLESRNGIRLGPTRVATAAVEGTLRCRLGGTDLEMQEISEAPTLEIAAHEWRRLDQRRGLNHYVGSLLLGLAGWLGYIVIQPDYWSPWHGDRMVSLLWNGLGLLVALPFLAVLLLIALKAVGRRLRFADPLRALAQLVWLWPLAFVLSYLLYYLVTAGVASRLRHLLMLGALVAAVVHLASLRRPDPNRAFRLAWALGVGLLVASLSATASLAQHKLGMPSVDYHVQVPLAGFAGPTHSLDDYLAQVETTAGLATIAAATVRAKQGIPDAFSRSGAAP
jgi:hypothetical protein